MYQIRTLSHSTTVLYEQRLQGRRAGHLLALTVDVDFVLFWKRPGV